MRIPSLVESYRQFSCQKLASSCYKVLSENKVKSVTTASIAFAAIGLLVYRNARSQNNSFISYYYTLLCAKYSIEKEDRAKACYNFALMNLNDDRYKQDFEVARSYAKLAAQGLHCKASVLYAKMCLDGTGGDKDISQAKLFFKKAIDISPNSLDSLEASVRFYLVVITSPYIDIKEANEAIEYLQKAALKGYADANYYIALEHLKGRVVVKCYESARSFFYEASVSKCFSDSKVVGESLFHLGLMSLNDRGRSENSSIVKAMENFKKAAEQEKHMMSATIYADMCFEIEDTYFNKEEALSILKSVGISSAVQEPDLLYNAARYSFTRGHFDIARRFFQRAAEKGHIEAMYNFGLMTLKGEGGGAQPEVARECFKQVCEGKTHLDALFYYATMCLKGQGGDQDHKTAREMFQIASNLGDDASSFQLALMYYKGEGGEANKKLARDYFSKIEGIAYRESKHLYALMCLIGDGGDEDLKSARDNFSLISNSSHEAGLMYALMCYNGMGGPLDKVTAEAIFSRLSQMNYSGADIFYSDSTFDLMEPSNKRIFISKCREIADGKEESEMLIKAFCCYKIAEFNFDEKIDVIQSPNIGEARRYLLKAKKLMNCEITNKFLGDKVEFLLQKIGQEEPQ